MSHVYPYYIGLLFLLVQEMLLQMRQFYENIRACIFYAKIILLFLSKTGALLKKEGTRFY
ncbi:hypothetical protein P40081_33205 [Paenibacillus sp. FSL P4-0081]|nr:hypothetical protein P40081_33205 [Paenibacillus sp. FSL P4-0081]